MSDNVNYGIIHEIGEYSEVVELSEEDNKKVNSVERENNNK